MKRKREPRERKPRSLDDPPWSPAERSRLGDMLARELDPIYCAKKLARTRESIEREIKRMKLSTYEPDPMEAPLKKRECLRCGREFEGRFNRLCPRCHDSAEIRDGVDCYFVAGYKGGHRSVG